jgi:HEAT repeat protein
VNKKIIFAAALVAMALGCAGDPDDATTWIKKLDDVREQKEALRNLQRLKQPVALKPLMDMYLKDKDPAVLDVIVAYESPDAVPALIKALPYTKENFDASARAAEALGRLKASAAVDELIKMLEVPLDIKDRANLTKQAAIRALAKIKDARAVPALAALVEGMPDKQDLFLNKVAALALAEIPDARAVPSLLKGLFISRADGATIFQECRYALVRIGEPAVGPLVELLKENNAALNAMAKQLDFQGGVLGYKAAYVLGDLRSPKAVAPLLARLREPDKSKANMVHAEVLRALGAIATGDPTGAAGDAIRDKLKDAKADPSVRQAACDAALLAGDAKAIPLMFEIVKNAKGDANLRVAAAMSLSRLGDQDAFEKFAPIAKSENYAEFKEALERLQTAKACGTKVDCYAGKLASTVLVQQEKAAFMLGLVPTSAPDKQKALAALVGKLDTQEPVVRLAVLEGIKRLGGTGCEECAKKLQTLITKEEKMTRVPAYTNLVNEMRVVLARLTRA